MKETVVNPSGKELLDATREAVIDAADNVEKVLHNATAEMEAAAHHEELFYQSPEFWVGVSCIVALAVLALPIRNMMLQFFEKRRQGIIKRIDDAAALKTEARELLASYERKLENLEFETGEIVKKAKRDAARLKKTSTERMEQAIALRERYAEEKIADAENRITSEITARTAEQTVSALRRVLPEKISPQTQARLIDESIDLLPKLKEPF